MAGVYTAEERVVRDGMLIAFAGEVMTNEEATERGLLVAVEEEPEPKAKTPKDELIERAEALGIDLPKKATVVEIEKLIAAAAEADAAAVSEVEAESDEVSAADTGGQA
jgi:enoyl-CoA hydratase/carnithine racemase